MVSIILLISSKLSYSETIFAGITSRLNLELAVNIFLNFSVNIVVLTLLTLYAVGAKGPNANSGYNNGKLQTSS